MPPLYPKRLMKSHLRSFSVSNVNQDFILIKVYDVLMNLMEFIEFAFASPNHRMKMPDR